MKIKNYKFLGGMGNNIHSINTLHLLLNLGQNKVLTSASIAFFNSSSSHSRIFLYLAHSSDIFLIKGSVHSQVNKLAKEAMSHN